MAPVRIRYHVPESPSPRVVRYNDPLTERSRRTPPPPRRQRGRPNNRRRKPNRYRDNVSDFEYDYGPSPVDFEHMRRSVPEKYWGRYDPRDYRERKRWEDLGDDRFYDFKYEHTHHGPAGYGGDDDDDDDYRYDRDYARRIAQLDYDRGYDSDHRGRYPRQHYDSTRRLPHPDDYYNRRYQTHNRGRHYNHDHHPDRRLKRNYHHDYYYNDSPRRPQFVQSEIILPRERYRPLPYLGDPLRKPHEHRRRLPPPHAHAHRTGHYDHNRHYHGNGAADSYFSDPIYREERARYSADARAALLRKRNHNNYCEACPEKSSKYIPTMHYDELKCPNCLDRVQPRQEEVLAYPWTVLTYRPDKYPTDVPESVITPSIYTNGGAATNRTAITKAPATEANAKTEAGKSKTGNNNNNSLSQTGNNANNAASKANAKTEPTKDNNTAANKAGQSKKSEPAGKENNKTTAAEAAGANSQKLPDKEAKTKDDKNSANGKQNDALSGNNAKAAPSKPIFRANSEVGTEAANRRRSVKANKENSQRRPLSTVHEDLEHNANKRDSNKNNNISSDILQPVYDFDDYDDIRPQDSVSNVRLPPLRAYPREPNMTSRHNPWPHRPRAETELTAYSYPSGRYFPSLEYVPPPAAQATPLPRGHTGRSDLSRRMRGQYYDWRSGRKYEYDINYRGRRVMADRRLLR